jgi:hypothetical protein
MSEGASSREENANLYMRGVNEGRAGELLDGEELLAILDVFGEDSLRSYILGHLEGIADAMEDLQRLAETLNHGTLRLHESLLPNRQVRAIGRGMKGQAHTCSR